MREYLKAIGFSDLNSRKKIDELINEIKKNPSRKNWFQIDEEEAIFIYEKDFAEAVGIAIIEVMYRWISSNGSFLPICSRCELPVS